ncbi:nucleotidyltransferase family protein [Rhizobium sp. C4]|uniref:nucleotidyltransferase family protein n=1 Tax=Rhizobium sp. C4 TaxID=1349800 RepID=UPI001E4FD465|nr:nucleotidyltransferase domain-containing protein [Rhizobium sp. C4]MCD2172995.1 nucleotidyltransferase domain-containing protein [Rhizobium sp. C4]
MKPSVALERHREAIRRIVAAHRASNARIFGSALTGLDGDDSDLDIIVDPSDEMTLFDIGAIRHELGTLLGVEVDVVTPLALPQSFRDRVLAEALAV